MIPDDTVCFGGGSAVYHLGKSYDIYGQEAYMGSSAHRGGVQGVFADGAVRFLTDTIDLNVYKAIVTRNGGENVTAGSF